MHTVMLIQNIKHSYIMVSRKYTNFATFFFSWDMEESAPSKIDTTLGSTYIIPENQNISQVQVKQLC